MSAQFHTTVHGTVHAHAIVPAGEADKATRQIAAGARHHGATGPALRKTVEITSSHVVVHIAYRGK